MQYFDFLRNEVEEKWLKIALKSWITDLKFGSPAGRHGSVKNQLSHGERQHIYTRINFYNKFNITLCLNNTLILKYLLFYISIASIIKKKYVKLYFNKTKNYICWIYLFAPILFLHINFLPHENTKFLIVWFSCF